MKKIVVFLLVTFLGLSVYNCKKEEINNKVVVATDATWPPMEFINEKTGDIVGFDIDLMKEIAKEGNFKVEFKNVEWDNIFNGLEEGKYDAVISSLTITEERKINMDFSIPYINAGQILIISKSGNNNILKLEDLKGKIVGAQTGTTGASEIQKINGVTLQNYDKIESAIEDLASNKISGVVTDTPIAANIVLLNPEYKDKLKIVGKRFTDEFYGIAVKKGNKKILDMINSGLQKVLDTGKNSTIEDEWLW